MTDVITTDTVDRTIATLKATRDGLQQTLMNEEHERAKRTQTLVETAHEWADRHGIDGFEPMMEELSLPGRAPRRHIDVSNGGYLTLHYTFPYNSSLLSGSAAARLVDIYDQNVTLTERLYLGSPIDVGRVEGNHCICDWKVILDNYCFVNKVTRVLDENSDIVVTIEGELSCDSPSCTHGESEVETTPGVDDQPCTIAGHLNGRHSHYRSVSSLDEVLCADFGRHYIPSGSIISSGTFLRETVAIDEASEEPVHQCEGYPHHPDGVHLHVSDSTGHMMFSSDLTFTEPRWTFHGHFDKAATTPEPEPAPERDTYSVYLCTESTHPLEGMHQHYSYDSGLVTYAEENYMPEEDGGGTRVYGLFTKEERELQSCTIGRHPEFTEHRHFVNSNGPTSPRSVSHSTDLTYAYAVDAVPGRTRSPGTFRRDV